MALCPVGEPTANSIGSRRRRVNHAMGAGGWRWLGRGRMAFKRLNKGVAGGRRRLGPHESHPFPPPPTRPRSSRGLWLKPTGTQGAMVSAIRGVGGHHLWGVAERAPDQTQRARRPAHSSGSRDVVDHPRRGVDPTRVGRSTRPQDTWPSSPAAFKAQLATTRGATRPRPAAAAQLRWRGQQSIRSLRGRGGASVGTHAQSHIQRCLQ